MNEYIVMKLVESLDEYDEALARLNELSKYSERDEYEYWANVSRNSYAVMLAMKDVLKKEYSD